MNKTRRKELAEITTQLQDLRERIEQLLEEDQEGDEACPMGCMGRLEQLDLLPGEVPAEQFDLLITGTDIRGPKVGEALRLHLVSGVTPKEACEQTGANRGQFSLRLKAIHDENKRVIQLLKFYGIA